MNPFNNYTDSALLIINSQTNVYFRALLLFQANLPVGAMSITVNWSLLHTQQFVGLQI